MPLPIKSVATHTAAFLAGMVALTVVVSSRPPGDDSMQRTLALRWLPKPDAQAYYPEFGVRVYGQEEKGKVTVRVEVLLGREGNRRFSPPLTATAPDWPTAAQNYGQIEIDGDTIRFGPGGLTLSRKSFESMD